MESAPKNFEVNESAKPLFNLILARHEHTNYENSDPSLSSVGYADAYDLGVDLANETLFETEPAPILLHSPQKRTEETLKQIVAGAHIDENLPRRAIDQLRTADKGPNYQEFVDAQMKVVNEEGALNEQAWDKMTKNQYGNDDLYTKRPDVVETKGSRQKRLYRSLEYLIRWLEKHNDADSTQNVIAVSHFEIIMHIIDDVFDIESFDTHHQPEFGDHLEIKGSKTDSEELIKLEVTYKGRTKEVLFDRNSRMIMKIYE